MSRWRCLLGLAVCLAGGCRTVEFYAQAAAGQFEVLAKRRPAAEVIAASDDPALRARLELTRKLLDFAETELHMSAKGNYRSYAALGREHLVWVVHAAPELTLEEKEWWYPVVGRQSYRGYFREDLAADEAARLAADGYDTYVGGVDAYSTLGWFRDPVLDTFAGRPEIDFAELIFHELAHVTHYVSGETAFNEGLAEAVAREGVRRWLRATGRPRQVARYDRRLTRLARVREVIGGTAERLEALYASDLAADAMRAGKAREIERLRTRLRALRGERGRGLDSWIDGPINNARLNAFTTYEAEVPRFAGLLRRCDGDFARFWERVRSLPPAR